MIPDDTHWWYFLKSAVLIKIVHIYIARVKFFVSAETVGHGSLKMRLNRLQISKIVRIFLNASMHFLLSVQKGNIFILC